MLQGFKWPTPACPAFRAGLLLAFLTLAAGGLKAAEVRVEPALAGSGKLPPGLVLEARRSDGEEPMSEPLAVSFPDAGARPVALEDWVAWRLRFRADGFWSPETLVIPGEADDVVRIPLFPTQEVAGSIEMAGAEPEPAELTLRFATPTEAGRSPALRGEVSCPVHSRRFDCRPPVGRFDLRLRARGFVSHFFFDREIGRDGPADLGSVRLERGASIVGWVRTADGEAPAGGLAVTALPEEPPSAARGRPPEARRGLRRRPHERGFFHLDGLEPGAYVVAAEGAGYAATRTLPVRVPENVEIELADTLVLQKPLVLTVAVDPPTEIGGKPWKIALFDPPDAEPAATGRTGDGGIWRSPALEPGRYRLMVTSSAGARLAVREVTVDKMHSRVDLRLPVVWVEGRVSLGDEPLAATVAFGGLSGRVSIPLRSDDEGRFSGWVTRPGAWDVDVTADEPHVFRRLRKVPVEPDASGVAEVEIRLADTRLEGEVVDGDGRPVEKAAVVAMLIPAVEKVSSAKTDEEGRFRLRGVAPGTYRLQALLVQPSGPLSSEPQEVTVDGDHGRASVRLVLEATTTLRGTLLSDLGPVADATVQAGPRAGSRAVGLLAPSTRSGADGTFEIRLPQKADAVDLTVLAPGFMLLKVRLPAQPSAPPVLHLAQGGGTLALALAEPLDVWDGHGKPYVRYEGETMFPLTLLEVWASLHQVPAEKLRILAPAMPPGRYDLCSRSARGTRGGAGPGETCTGGVLVPGGTLQLEFEPVNKERTHADR